MKKLILFLVIFLFSCSGTKQMQTNTAVDHTAGSSASVTAGASASENETFSTGSSSSAQLDAVMQENETASKNLKISEQTTEYDTDKPADPGTGLPPVKSVTNREIISDSSLEKGKTIYINLTAQQTDSIRSELRSEYECNLNILLDELEEYQLREETLLKEKKSDVLKAFFVGFGTAVLIGLIVVLIWFFWKK